MHDNFVYRPNCPLCNLEGRRIVLLSKEFTDPHIWNFLDKYYEGRVNKNDLTGGKYEIVECSKCGFILQAYIPNDELMGKLYSIWTSSKTSPVHSIERKSCANISLFRKYADSVECIAHLLSKRPFEITVLDYGMGWGFWALMAKAFGYKVIGFEIAREKVDFARKNSIEVIDNIKEISSYEYDFIHAEQVFEHIPEPLNTLELLVKNLKRKGIIYISVPNGGGIEKEITKPGWKPSKNAIHPLEHINCFTHKTLIKLGNVAGLDLIRQPFILSRGNGLGSYFRGILSRYYRQYFGTSLYFRKKE